MGQRCVWYLYKTEFWGKENQSDFCLCKTSKCGKSDEIIQVKWTYDFMVLWFLTCNVFLCLQNLDIQVEDVRIRAILSTLRKRVPVTEGYVEVKDGGKWKQICNVDWNDLDSRVICGMFGFPSEKRYNARVYRWADRTGTGSSEGGSVDGTMLLSLGRWSPPIFYSCFHLCESYFLSSRLQEGFILEDLRVHC